MLVTIILEKNQFHRSCFNDVVSLVVFLHTVCLTDLVGDNLISSIAVLLWRLPALIWPNFHAVFKTLVLLG